MIKFALIFFLSLLYGCATTPQQPISSYSHHQLLAMLRQINAQLDYYQYYPPKEREYKSLPAGSGIGANLAMGAAQGMTSGLEKRHIQDLLNQRAAILTELQMRRDRDILEPQKEI